MVVDEDRVIKQGNPTALIIKEFLKSVFYSAIIHFMNYSLKLPAIFSVLPLMVLILLVMLFTRYWKNKKRQYAFLIPYVAEYFGYCLYFYNRGHLMVLTATCMTAILAVWGVLCIECFTKNVKRNLIGFVILALVATGAYLGIWKYYSVKIKDGAEKIAVIDAAQPELAAKTDELLTELNAVFYQKKKVTFRVSEVIKKAKEEELNAKDGEWISSRYQEFQKELADVKGISGFFDAGVRLSKDFEKFYEK